MGRSVFQFLAAGAVGLLLAFSTAPAVAKTAAECNADYAANKAAIKASGQTKKDYVAACRAGTAPATAAPAPAPSAAAAPPVKTAAQCNAEYAANQAAIKAGGQTKRAFVAACRSGTETIPAAAAAPAAPAPYQQPAAPAPPPFAPSPHVGATGAGGFATDAQARARCPSDTVVWVNTKSRIYHFAGTHNYGNTREGTYMCEAGAKAAGDRAAENEKHP